MSLIYFRPEQDIFKNYLTCSCRPRAIDMGRSSAQYKTYLSRYLTKLMHKICFTISFISCLYMFRAHVLIIRRSKLHYTASGIITPMGGRLVHDG